MQLSVDLVDHFAEMVVVVREIIMVSFDYQHFSQLIRLDPCFIPFIKPLEIIQPD
jgi:hypothetical protein